jgi:curved DNA-binding protein CbpA
MDSEPLPDHFKALGVDRNADASAIKKAHRLLVLQCHPDKVTVTDPVIKQQKADQFHQIQKAYETLIDEKERATYEANLTLEALRKEKLARGGASTSREKSTRFDARPSGGASSRYATEERKPSTSYDDDKYYDERARDRARTSTRSKYDTYSSYPKSASSPRTEKESSRSAKSTTERQRSERTKARDKDDRRSRPFVSVDSDTSSADEKARYERDYKRRSHEEEVRKQDADARRKTDDRRSYEDPQYDASPSARKLSTLEGEALRYQHKSRADVESQHRPSIARNSSRDYYESSRSSRKESRPEPVRRSSARPKERATSSSTRDREGRDRDRGFPEIVDWGEGESSSRRMPPLKHNNSSPAGIEIPRNLPQRSYTAAEPSSRDRRTSTSPPPMLSRSQTMPSAHVSSRSKPAAASRGTPLYQSVVPEHSVPEHYASIPPPQPSSASKSTKYYYPTPAGGVPLRQEDILAGARTVLREPGSSQRHRSPESKAPLGRPPIGANRPSEANIHKTAMPPPPLGRSSSSPTREERGRSGRPLYGEVRTASYAQRPQPVRQGSYTPSGDVKYSQKIGPDDVRWSSRGRENNPDYPPSKPTLGRTATYVY